MLSTWLSTGKAFQKDGPDWRPWTLDFMQLAVGGFILVGTDCRNQTAMFMELGTGDLSKVVDTTDGA
mgnify:CR=1 FL=1|jgi:hypothetical protein